MSFFFLSIGLIGLWIGAMIVVSSGKAIAKRFGVSELLIGLTVVSIGTSTPEIMVSIFSGFYHASGIAVGAMIGSCLTQITLILGIAGLIHNLKATRKALMLDGLVLILSILVYWAFAFTDKAFSRIEGIIMVTSYIAYLFYTAKNDELSAYKKETGIHEVEGKSLMYRIFCLLGGLAILVASAEVVLQNALSLTQNLGLSQSFIGVMIIGVATCLPELSTAIVAVIKKSPGISVGSLIGSNITDPLLSIGLGTIVHEFDVSPELLYFDIPFWLLSSILALLLLHRRRLTLNKAEASILVVVFIFFAFSKIRYFS